MLRLNNQPYLENLMRTFTLLLIATLGLSALLLASTPRVTGSLEPKMQSDVLCFRTFTPDDFSTVNPSTMVDIPLKWTVTLQNTGAARVNHLTIIFSGVIDNIVSCAPFNRAQRVPNRPQAWDLSGATMGLGDVVTIHGMSNIPGLKVFSWNWMYDIRQATRTKGPMTFAVDEGGVLMPTPANIIQNLFQQGNATRVASNNQSINACDGILLGIPRPDSARSYAWVRVTNFAHTRSTLGAWPGYNRYGHTGTPQSLALTNNGSRLFGELPMLSPTRQNNRLIGSLLGLKLNVIASAKGFTPGGLADLVYCDPSSPYFGSRVSTIIRKADSLLTFFKGHTADEYLSIAATLERINAAFNGPVDTISTSALLQFTGIPNPAAANYLAIAPPDPPPAAGHAQVNIAEPYTFNLGQNFPNPFNPSTVIPFTLAEPSTVRLVVYNLIGQEVKVLIDGDKYNAGDHQVTFVGGKLATGTYFYRLTGESSIGSGGRFSSVRKMSIMQ